MEEIVLPSTVCGARFFSFVYRSYTGFVQVCVSLDDISLLYPYIHVLYALHAGFRYVIMCCNNLCIGVHSL